ncbi:MAG: hypothetical protein AB7S57_18800 [Acetobacteraceae bacterium]
MTIAPDAAKGTPEQEGLVVSVIDGQVRIRSLREVNADPDAAGRHVFAGSPAALGAFLLQPRQQTAQEAGPPTPAETPGPRRT